MNKRRERTLQDLCDATATLPKLEVRSQINQGFGSCVDRNQKLDYTGNTGVCNLCAAPSSSCLHVRKVLMSPINNYAGEICAESVVVDRDKKFEIEKSTGMSSMVHMNSNFDSSCENAVRKASSKTSSASDDNVCHSKFEGQGVTETNDDCFSSAVGTDERANRKSGSDDVRLKYSRHGKSTGENSNKVRSSAFPLELSSQNSGLVEIPRSKLTDDATDPVRSQNILSESSSGKSLSLDSHSRGTKYDKPLDTRDELKKGTGEPLVSLTEEVGPDVLRADPSAKVIEKNDDMEVDVRAAEETDDSDVVEQDVKVCDICGDAGREDSLAICCRCSDGAEHTYCMREMLETVPEGDWLCEECSSAEHARIKKEKKVDYYEKNNSSYHASSDSNSSEVEEHRTKGRTKRLGKRLRDDADAEVSSMVKNPAVDSIVGSPKTSVSGKTATLSRENSAKNLDKGRLLPSFRSSEAANYAPESARASSDQREKNFGGTFSKSSSFNALNSKPKVKLVDQVVFQRQKSARVNGPSFRHRDGVSRSIGKSISFSSNRSESKIESLSPRISHWDMKSTKPRSSFERQSSFKTEHPSRNSPMGTSVGSTSRTDKKQSLREVSSSLTSINNNNEMKPVKVDGKSAALSRSSSLAARRNDLPSSVGDFKRPSLHGRINVPVSSTNGVHSTEQKYNQISPKEDLSSCATNVEKPASNGNDGSQPRDFASSGEQMSDTPRNRFRPPPAKFSRDDRSDIKAAIEAAMLKRPGIYRKHKALGQPDDSSVSKTGSESQHNRVSDSDGKRKFLSSVEMSEGQRVLRKLNTDTVKPEGQDHVKQLVPAEGRFSVDGKSSFNDVRAAMPLFLKSLIIPEHEQIWQGSFEIYRNGRTGDLWDGIQAHLSTCASPKVVQTVDKVKNRIVLNEVPRLSTWPSQFQEHGVREDNIALFFFAKDLESYEKVYKILLDNMMKSDLALRGNVDGVELLIFPSNHLPNHAQRWNRLFFLWAVFRGKRESSLQRMPEFKIAPQDISKAVTSLAENASSLISIDKVLPASESIGQIPQVHGPEKSHSLLPTLDRVGDEKEPSAYQQDSKLNPSLSVTVQSDGGKQSKDPMITFLERGRNSSFSGRDEMVIRTDTPPDRQHPFSKSPEKEIAERSVLHRGVSNNNEVRKGPESRDFIDLNVEYSRDEPLEEDDKDLFPTEPDTMKGLRFLEEQGSVRDRAPSLELALGGAESKIVGKLDENVNDDEANDVSASLSLSLSYPFPEKEEQNRKLAGSNSKQSMLLFGGLAGNESRK